MSEPLELYLQACAESACSKITSGADKAGRIKIDPETVEQDLARLVLSLMEFLRQLMELQAIRRSELGSISEAQVETLGNALMQSEKAIHDIAKKFNLEPEDLFLELGPLGRTV